MASSPRPGAADPMRTPWPAALQPSRRCGAAAALLLTLAVLLAVWHSTAPAGDPRLQASPPRLTRASQPAAQASPARPQQPAPASRSPGWPLGSTGSSTQPRLPLVQKRAFSAAPTRLRLLFIAGLEGSGHHLWETAWERVLDSVAQQSGPANGADGAPEERGEERNSPNCDNTTLPVCLHARLSSLFKWTFWDPQAKLRLAPPAAERAGALFEQLRGTLKVLRAKAEGDPRAPPQVVVLNTLGGVQMSYPFAGGPDKSLQTPDLMALAALCEELGVDLRVLVLRRSMEGVAISTTKHRRFGFSAANELRVLSDSLAVLTEQLRLVDTRFFVCLDYDSSPPQREAECRRVQAMLGLPRSAVDICSAVAAAIAGHHPARPHAGPNGDAVLTGDEQAVLDYLYARRTRLLDVLCRHGAGDT